MKMRRYDCNPYRVKGIKTWIQSRNLTEHTSMQGVQTSLSRNSFSWSFVKMIIDQLGLGLVDFGAVVAIVSGRNTLPTRAKPNGAEKGTSYASKASRKVFKKAQFPFGIKLPSVIGGYPPSTIRIKAVANIGTFTGRAIPVVGWVILASDISQITYCTIRDYNAIARGNDKLW